MITIKEIAKKLRIAPSTVSRALNDKKGVSSALRVRIQNAAQSMGYHPNYTARALVGSRKGIIAVIIPRPSRFIFSNAYNSYVLKGITTAAKKHNNDVIFSFADKTSFASLYLKNLTDGLIILNHRDDDRNRIIELEEKQIPSVLIPGLDKDNSFGIPSIQEENIRSMFEATDYLISLGHERIAIFLGSLKSKYIKERIRGYQSAFEKNNLKIPEGNVIKNCSLRKNYAFKIMKKILKEPNPPTAVISGLTDTFTLGLIQAVYSEGMTFPKDISVVTLGGSDSVTDIRPTLTAIMMPWEELGKKAVQMLMKVIDGVKLRKNHIVLQSEFMINESTAAPPSKR